jgi:hypothetical protein
VAATAAAIHASGITARRPISPPDEHAHRRFWRCPAAPGHTGSRGLGVDVLTTIQRVAE